MAIWLVRHDIFNKKNEHSDKELAFEELTIPLPQLLFKQNAYINSLRRTSRFIVAYASINTYDDVKPVLVGDPIVHLNELEARHIKENKLNNYVALDEQSNMSSTVESPEERKSYRRNAIIVWPNTGTLSPKIIYLRCEYGGKQGSELPKLVDTYGDWVLLQTWYNERLCREYDLIDLNGNQWIKGQIPSHCDSTACIQFASRDQFQFLVWTVMFKSVKPDSNSASDTAQKLQTFGSKNQLPYIKWELFNASKGQSQYEVLLSNQITIPFYPNAIIKAEMYTEKMCLINVFESGYRPDFTRDGTFSASLSLFAFDKSSSNTSAQSLFDARDYGQLLPIDSSDQGRILWTRDIRSDTITPLYSEKLIIVQNHESFEVLDARDGNLVRSITRPLFSNFAPFIGSLCVILDGEHGASWFVDVNTGDTHKPPACIIENQTEGDSENGSLGIAETFPVLSRYATIKSSRYTVSNTVIGRVNAKDNSVYESYTL
ncbi:hypothetical protein BDF19DRAFT_43673 [Syncephalis fuscata]|nr:hypothetical protein BDF19DRAFT_43673 [Syncephalis fuscata]